MSNVEHLPPDIRAWLPWLSAMRGGGLESLIKAISGLGQVGPKPEFAPGANADTWPRVRRGLEELGLLRIVATGHTDAPYLRFADALNDWLAAHPSTDARLVATRNHQRHYFQFAGQLIQLRHRDPAASAALTRLEHANLRAAVVGVLEQGEEWALEFVDRIGQLFDDIGEPWGELHERADRLAGRLGGEPWRLRISNRTQRHFDAGEFHAAEGLLHELLAGLGETDHFERASAWARIAQCRLRVERARDARAALMTAAGLCAELQRTDAVAEMQRDIALDLIRLCDDAEAMEWWQLAIACHASLRATRERLAGFDDFIDRVVLACANSEAFQRLAPELTEARASGWHAGADAVSALVAGERDLFKLGALLDLDDTALIAEVLRRLTGSPA
ncbi:MAG: hypothetical protein H6980_00265 [Gammaproteobacteria bacterium]|nr:hypothetical protein [Gammaproteobacteria bacterium]